MNRRGDDIEKYLKGELTSAGMHALEKEALSDPFLAEALEGGAQLDAVDFSKDVAELNEKIMKRKSTSWTWPVRIAASLLLLAVSTFIVWIMLQQDSEKALALEQSTPSPLQDSLLSNEKKPAPTLSETEKSKESTPLTLQAESAKETSGTSNLKLRPKKSSSQRIAEKSKGEQAPELSETVDKRKIDDKVSTRITKGRLDKPVEVVTIDPNKKDELQPPSAIGIKLAEGYIASVDARPTIVTGRVMSAEDGTPLPDVSVALKGTSVTTKTDAYGRYAIMANSRDKTLVYSSEGLESTEVKIEGIDSTYLPVKLEITEEAQEEAAVEPNVSDFGPTHVYTIPAHPETGNRAFKQYLVKNYQYPKEAKEKNVEGTVVIEFKIDATGGLSEFKIVRGIGNGCDEEVIRLILQGVKWVPTTKDGTPVNDKARVKFKFELEE